MEDLATIRKLLSENPENPWGLKGAAAYYLKEANYKQAQKTYLQAMSFSPRVLPQILLDYEQEIGNQPDKIGPRLSLAGFLLGCGLVDEVILELEEAIEVNQLNVEAYNVLGRMYIKQGSIDEAIALLERSIAAGVKDVNLSETLAGAYLETGRIVEAAKFYEEILNQKPNDKQILRILGELHTRLENYTQAAHCYQAMFSDDPEVVHEVIKRLEDLLKKVEGSVEIREILADIYIKTINPEAAIAKIKEILRLESLKLADIILKLKLILKSYPNLPSAVLTLGEALARQGNFSEASECYYQLMKAKPEYLPETIEGFRSLLEVCPEQVLARAHLGEALLAQNKILEALAEFGKMVEADPGVADLVVKKCREVLHLQPQTLQAHVVLGQAYLAKQDYQRAVIEAEGVIALSKTEISAYLLLGEAYFRLNQLTKAAETLHTALMLEPFNLTVHERYRAVKEQRLQQEIEAYQAKLKDDQWNASLHFELAKGYWLKNEKDKAVRELQIVQKDSLRAAPALNLLGNIYRSEGRYDLALTNYNQALVLANKEQAINVRFNCGTATEALGNLRKAIKIYEEIIQEDIDYGNLKRRLKQLKATSLGSMRNKALLMALADYDRPEVIALWGRESRLSGRSGKKDEVNVSFGQEHNDAGFDYYLKGMYQAAEEEFVLATQLDRHFATALNNLVVTLARQGKYEEARLKMMEATELEPASAIFYNNLGVVYFLLEKLDLAKAAFDKSLELDPDNSAASLNLGDLSYHKKEIQKALELYKKVGEFDPLADLIEHRLLYKIP